MAVVLKLGARYRSATCSTEVVVVRGAGEADLRCGGAAMVQASDGSPSSGASVSPFDQGTLIGKRYVDVQTGLEVLCVKAGEGSLSLGDSALAVQAAKVLPASD
jgi:hypothetical protein